MAQQIENMTIRNKLNESERIIRELVHHLDHGFIPKAHLLRRTARKGNDPQEQHEVTDLTVRSTVSKTLEADDFSQRLSSQLDEYLLSIEKDLNRIIGN